jgi:hypothetical protein
MIKGQGDHFSGPAEVEKEGEGDAVGSRGWRKHAVEGAFEASTRHQIKHIAH